MSLNTPPTPSWISADDAAFIQKGISISVASRDARHVPSVSRALGCRVTEDGSQLEVILNESQSATLLRDIIKTGAIAVVFSEPSTHRTLQVKGLDACILPAGKPDMALATRSTEAFAREIGQLGFPETFTGRLMACLEEDLKVIRFTPLELYQQTPGPEAGKRLDQVE